MPTVRVASDLKSALEDLAERRGQSVSEVIRDAVLFFTGQDQGSETALDRLRPFVGIVDSGHGQLSERTGEGFRRILEEKRNARRSG